VVGAFAAFALGCVVGIGKIVWHRGGVRSVIAFGPFMVAGALLSMFIGSAVADLYFSLVIGG